MKKIILLCSILLLLMVVSGCVGETKKEKEKPIITEELAMPVIYGVTEGAIYTSGVAISVEENSGLKYTLLLNNESIENGKIVIDDGDYTLVVTVKNSDNTLSKEKVVKFKITKGDAAPAGNILDMITIAEKLESEKRQAYINSNFERLKTDTVFPIINGDIATFVYKGSAKVIVIAGGVAGGFEGDYPMPLKKIEGTDFFYKSLEFPDDTKLEYKYIADGVYVPDVLNKIVTNNEFKNNELVMSKYINKVERDYHADIPHGTVEDKVISCTSYTNSGSIVYNAQRKYSVYLPYGYSKDKRYKTIYFQDGKGYINEAFVPNILDYMIANKEIEPMVAIFINFVGDDRDADYINTTKSKYVDFLVDTFIPKMETDYSLVADKEGRILVGASNSGAFIVYAAYKYPDKFKYLLSHSGAFNVLNDQRFDTTTFKNLITAKYPVKIFLSAGYYETWVSMNGVMYDVLKNNLSVEAIKCKKYNMTHCYQLWGDCLREGLLWLLDPNSKTTIEEKSEQKMVVGIGWKKTTSSNIKQGAKCYLQLTPRQNKSVFETIFNGGTKQTGTLIEIVPGLTENIKIPLSLSTTTVLSLSIFYDNNSDGVYNTGDYQCTMETNNYNIIIDKEDAIFPRMIVGQYK